VPYFLDMPVVFEPEYEALWHIDALFCKLGLCACAQLYLLRWASTKHAITK
jgi:hypothetical protein